MELFAKWIPRILGGILSLLDASNLRNRVHEIQNEHELMWTALDDISRMHKDTPAGNYAKKALENVVNRYSR